MSPEQQKKEAIKNKELWDLALGGNRAKFIENTQKNMEFYLNEQLSEQEKKDLEAAGMPTFTVNKLTPSIDIMKYFITAKNPRWKAVGRDGSDSDIASIHEDMNSYLFQISNGRSIMGKFIRDILVKSVGAYKYYVDPNADRGYGEIKMEYIPITSIAVDPASKDMYRRDASWVIIKMMKSKDQLRALLPDKENLIKDAPTIGASLQNYSKRDTKDTVLFFGEDIFNTYNKDKIQNEELVEYYERYTKYKVKFYNLTIKKTLTKEQLDQIKKIVEVESEEMTKEMTVKLDETVTELNNSLAAGEILKSRRDLEVERATKRIQSEIEKFPELRKSQLMQNASMEEDVVFTEDDLKKMAKADPEFLNTIVTQKEFWENRVRVIVSIGEKTFVKEVLYDIEDIPVMMCSYIDTDTPYSVSALQFGVGSQEELNKTHQLTVHHANLSSSLRWMHEDGAIKNEDEWDENSTIPGARLVFNEGATPPVPVQPLPLNNAFFSLSQNSENNIEYILGIPRSSMGETRDSREPYRSILAQDEFSTRRIKSWVNNVYEPFLDYAGNVYKNMAQKFYTTRKVMRIVQPVSTENENNPPMTKKVTINETIYNDKGKVIGKYNDYASGRFDVVFVSGSTLPVSRWALLEELFKWYQAELIPDSTFIAQTDLPEKEKIIRENSMLSRLKNQLNLSEEEIKMLRGQIQTLVRQLISAGIKNKVMQGDTEITKETEQTKAALKVMKEMEKLSTKEKINKNKSDNGQ